MGIKEFFAQRKAKKLFPKQVKDFWYCYEIYNYQHELKKQGKPWRTAEMGLPCEKLLINPYKNSDLIRVGAILPLMKVDGWIGFYEITKKWMYSSPGSDFASWDDGSYVNLKLHHLERVKVELLIT